MAGRDGDHDTTSAYDRGRAGGEQALRSSLLDVAGDLLVAHGPDALTMRRVAEASGCSTTVLYRLFESKHGLVAGLYREGFDRLHERLREVERTDDPVVDLGALGRAYRDQALAAPAYYDVMFGRPVPEFTPSDEDVAHGRRSLRVLVEAVERASPDTDADSAWAAARVLWSAAHGVVSLELSGHLTTTDAEPTFTRLLAGAARAVLPTDPTHPRRGRRRADRR